MKSGKINHFIEVCRSGRNRIAHGLEEEPDQHHEEVDNIDAVNINYLYFNNKHLIMTANVKTSSNQASIIVPYGVETGSDGNIMSIHIQKNYS